MPARLCSTARDDRLLLRAGSFAVTTHPDIGIEAIGATGAATGIGAAINR